MQPRLILTLLLSATTLVAGQSSAQSAGAGVSSGGATPWLADRALGEGAGIKAGSVEIHPGVSAETGPDSNFLQRASSAIEEENSGPPVASWRFRVTPQVSVRTLDRSQESGKDQRTIAKPIVMFDASARASYNEMIALRSGFGSGFAKMRNVEGGGSLLLRILPDRVWSATLGGGYNYVFEPSNQGGFGARYSRHLLSAQAGIKWSPGGGSFQWTLLEYGTRFTLFDDAGFTLYDNGAHFFTTHGMWRFLPKTAVLYDGKLDIIRYGNDEVNDAEALQARIGLNGLLTKKLALLVMGGWAASFYRASAPGNIARNYDGIVGKAEAKWFLSSDGRLKEGQADVGASSLAAGYLRDYADSYLADFFRRDRVYAKASYLIGGRVITSAEGGVSFLGYPDLNTSDGTLGAFSETRIDVKGFVEYRPLTTVGINLQLLYDQNISKVLDFGSFSDDLSFNRFRAMIGARWFL